MPARMVVSPTLERARLGQFLFYSGGAPLPWIANLERKLPEGCVACRERRDPAAAVAEWKGPVLMLERHHAELPAELRGKPLIAGPVGSEGYILFRPPGAER